MIITDSMRGCRPRGGKQSVTAGRGGGKYFRYRGPIEITLQILSPSIWKGKGVFSYVQHLRGEGDTNCPLRTVLTACAAVPALAGIEHDRSLIPYLEDHISWTMTITSTTVFAFFVINKRWHFSFPIGCILVSGICFQFRPLYPFLV